jgi:pilus assembly protein Flp/PilA
MIKLYALMISQVARFTEFPEFKREEGQTLAEYALILTLIAAVVAGVIITVGSDISKIFTNIGNDL